MRATGKSFDIEKKRVYEAYKRSNPMEVRPAWTGRQSSNSKPT